MKKEGKPDSVFDKSDKFTFRIGKGEVIKGWDQVRSRLLLDHSYTVDPWVRFTEDSYILTLVVRQLGQSTRLGVTKPPALLLLYNTLYLPL